MPHETRAMVVAAIVLCALILKAPVTAQSGLMPTGVDFAFAGGNLANQRYSSLSQINRSTISRLGGAWTIHVSDGEPARNIQATPVVVGGVMYLGAGGDVLAIHASTGAIVWRYKSTFGVQNNRGVAVAEGKVFTGQAGSRVVALDQRTGALSWETRVYDGARRRHAGRDAISDDASSSAYRRRGRCPWPVRCVRRSRKEL